ncbi:MAG: hypothetical protein PHP29_09545, partial [Tissierellia bacterium]|nr:hypothetical protein [Tissierellia bacterium]
MSKKGKDCMPFTVKRSMAIVLSLMMIMSTLLGSGNLIYAADNGLNILKSATHLDGTVGKAVINDKNVTFTVPYNYSKDALDLTNVTNVDYVLESGYKLDRIDPKTSSAKVGGASITMTVHYTYTGKDTETTTGNDVEIKGSTEYNVNVKRGQPVIKKIKYPSAYVNTVVNFDAGDFEDV